MGNGADAANPCRHDPDTGVVFVFEYNFKKTGCLNRVPSGLANLTVFYLDSDVSVAFHPGQMPHIHI
jgi:hypothetical protein